MSPPGQMAEPQTSGGSGGAETLIRRAHQLLADCKVPLSPSRVSRLVREYRTKVEPRGIDFDTYLRTALVQVADSQTRRLAGMVLGPEEKSGRPTVHSDHATGERATWNVFVERDLLIGRAHRLLEAIAVSLSHQQVRRLVREYKTNPEFRGLDFDTYVRSAVAQYWTPVEITRKI